MRRNPPQFLETPSRLPPNLSFVLSISPSAMTLGLGNMRALLDAIGHPEKAFRSVLVAGTNGKGSVTAYLSAILEANGVHVGWYSSPHVYSVNERICVDNMPVPLETMEAAAARIVPLHDRIGYSYFEALTAIAFIIFAEAGIEIAVLETGLGGRFDATNVVDPEVSVLTSIALDHRRILGDSEEEILREKLGITRSGTPLLVGRIGSDLLTIVMEKAERDGFPLLTSEDLGNIDVESMAFDGVTARIQTRRCDYGAVRLPFLGRHQLTNALLAINAAESAINSVGNLEAAGDAYMPGRFEVLSIGHKHAILDVAHNDDALIVTAETLAALSPKENNAMVLGILDRKELTEFPRRLGEWFGRLYLVEPLADDVSASPFLLDRIGMSNLRGTGLDVVVVPPFGGDDDWGRFINHLLSPENPFDRILITGSHRTIEAFGRRFQKGGLI